MNALRASVCLVAFLGLAGAAWAEAAKPVEKPAKKPGKPRVTISKETTRITGPLREDGYPDYAAALNQRLGRGVTPENNAEVLVWRAMGPGEIEKEIRKDYFRLLGIEPLPEDGDYYVELADFVERRVGEKLEESDAASDLLDRLWDEQDEASERPWTKRDCPELAAWLEGNAGPIGLWIEASRRPRYYSPVVSRGEPLLDCFLQAGDMQHYREMSRTLRVRATLRLGEGDVDGACGDLLACHRLARLKAHGPFVVDWLVGSAVEGTACSSDAVLARSGKLSGRQLRAYIAELGKLSDFPSMANVLDVGERYFFLDSLAAAARDPGEFLPKLLDVAWPLDKDPKPLAKAATRLAAAKDFDWDGLFRTANADWDRGIAAYQPVSRKEREKASAPLRSDWDARAKRAVASSDSSKGSPPVQLTSEDRVLGLNALLFQNSAPLFSFLVHCDSVVQTRFSLARLAVALAICRAERGEYPRRLDELAPEYLPSVPQDSLGERPLHYERKGKGYWLYSVGLNGRDDGGKGADDHREGKDDDWDDIAVRVPAGKKGGK